jgi:DDE domain/Helix-turn-helix domain
MKSFVSIAGEQHWLWRAVDQNGFVLDVLIQRRRDTRAAQRLVRKLLKSAVTPPRVMITDKLRSSGIGRAAVREAAAKLGMSATNLYRLIQRFREDRRVSALLPRKAGRPAGTRFVSANVEAIIQTAVREIFLVPERPTFRELVRQVAARCRSQGERFCCNDICSRCAGAVGELSPPDRSCGAVEQVGDDDGLAPDIMTVSFSKLSLPHHRHRFETRQSSPRGMETAEAEPGPDKALDTPVVLLDDVVEVFALPQTGAAR